MTSSEAYVLAARRTPIGRVGGALKSLRVESLAAPVVRAVLADAGLSPGDVDDLVLGNVWGPGGNPARVAALTAGLDHVPGLTVDRQCASGLEAVRLAALTVRSGAAKCCLAGGAESLSTAPWRVAKPASLYEAPQFVQRARLAPDALGDPEMGQAADAVAQSCGVSRTRQDAFAAASHRKAVEAAAAGRFEEEIVAMPRSNAAAARSGAVAEPVVSDECPKARVRAESLAKLPAAFSPDGTVTAGNSSPLNDGAALVAVVDADTWKRLGSPPALRVVDTAAAAADPRMPGLGPVAAVEALHKRTGGAAQSVDVVEFTEAFAAQALACFDALGVDESAVNPGGGAIALGHPWGASGAVLVVRLFSEMVHVRSRPAPERGLAAVAGAGGAGVAVLVERV